MAVYSRYRLSQSRFTGHKGLLSEQSKYINSLHDIFVNYSPHVYGLSMQIYKFKRYSLYDYNIRILHWKTCGLDFGTKHLLMDDYHSQLNSYTDEISEMLMMTGNTAIPTFDQIIEIIKVLIK